MLDSYADPRWLHLCLARDYLAQQAICHTRCSWRMSQCCWKAERTLGVMGVVMLGVGAADATFSIDDDRCTGPADCGIDSWRKSS